MTIQRDFKRMIQVIKKGLETSVQDYPGRIGTLNQGFPFRSNG